MSGATLVVETPIVTRVKSFATLRSRASSTNCTPGNCASAIQSCAGCTRTIEPNGVRSRETIFAPSFLMTSSVSAAPLAKMPMVKSVPNGNGFWFTARSSNVVCTL